MTMNLADAVTALQTHARQMEAVQVVAGAIKDVQSIDQMRSEAEQGVSVATGKLADVNKQVDAAKDSLSRAKAEAERVAGAAETMAAKAKDDARAIVSEAQDAADRLMNDAKATMVTIQRDIAAARQVLADVEAGIDGAKAEAESILSTAKNDAQAVFAKAAAARSYLEGLTRVGQKET